MKKCFYLFVFMLFVFGSFLISSITKAVTDNIIQLVFITSEQTILTDTVSAVLTIETQNSSGVLEPLDTSGTVLELSSSSPTGEFSSNAVNWIPVSTLGMNNTWAHRNFYYKDSTAGAHTLIISAQGKTWTPATQTITINPLTTTDTTPPSLYLSPDIAEEATGADGAVVNFTVTADDTDPIHPEVICVPASGATFPIETTIVNCSATDTAGNIATGSFSVVVKDTTAPLISGVPEDITVETSSNSGTTVSYSLPTAVDLVDGTILVICSPASDSIFPVGETIVNCSATDATLNIASATFKVKVEYVALNITPPETRKQYGSYRVRPNVLNVPNTELIKKILDSEKEQVLGAEKYNFTKNLFFGVRSEEVKELQKFLISQGLLKKGAFGGFFGIFTQTALKEYQRINALWVDGIVGPQTRAMLNK